VSRSSAMSRRHHHHHHHLFAHTIFLIITWTVATAFIPCTHTRLGDRAFPADGPRLWNSLPSNLRQSDLTLHQFRRALKTCLFGRLRVQPLVTFCFQCAIQMFLLTYTMPRSYNVHTKTTYTAHIERKKYINKNF